MTYNLGVVCYSRHDAAAVLVEDGYVVAAPEEERFSRKKFDSSFPAQAIKFCLTKVGITPQDIAAIGYGFHPMRRFSSQTLYVVKNLPRSVELVITERPFVRRMNGIKRDFREQLGYSGPVYQLGHHLCHAASTFLASPFDEAAILTIDGLVNALYVPPCASDAGVALGAAYLAHKATTGKLQRQVLETALLGPDYNDEQILEYSATKAAIVNFTGGLQVSHASSQLPLAECESCPLRSHLVWLARSHATYQI